jgi:hypothetical protein
MPVKTKVEDIELRNNTSSSDNSQEIEGNIDLDYSESIVNGYRSNHDSYYNRSTTLNPNTLYAPTPPTNPFVNESQDYQSSNYSAFYAPDANFSYARSQQSTAQTTHTITTTNTVIQPMTVITVLDTTKSSNNNNNNHIEYRALMCLISSSILGILLLFLCPCLSCLPFMSMRRFEGHRNKRIKVYVCIGNTLSCILGTAAFILFICIYLPAIVVILG